MNEKPKGRPRKGTGNNFIRVLALFAIICGVILLLADYKGSEIAVRSGQKNLNSVMTDLNAATNALEDRNYGRVKYHLRAVRQRLTSLNEQ